MINMGMKKISEATEATAQEKLESMSMKRVKITQEDGAFVLTDGKSTVKVSVVEG